jgi:AbiV family abortive infection protein
LLSALRAYRAARVLHRNRLYAEAAAMCHRSIENIIEAAIAFRNIPILEASDSTDQRRRRSTHTQKQDRFRQHWLGQKTPFSREQLAILGNILYQMRIDERERAIYVDYNRAKAPTFKKRESEELIKLAKTFYKLVRPHLHPLP